MTDPRRKDIVRDIEVARAELSGRRDHLIGEYDDRLMELDRVAAAVEDGSIAVKDAESKVRKLLGEGRGSSVRQAGRGRVGMTVPQQAATKAPPPPMGGPTGRGTRAATEALLSELEVGLLDRLSSSGAGLDRARLEVSALCQIRSALRIHLNDMPEDVVLLSGFGDFVDQAAHAVRSLSGGGRQRVIMHLDHVRSLASQLGALGGDAQSAKSAILRLREALDAPEADLEHVESATVELFNQLQQALGRVAPHDNLLGAVLDPR